MKINVWAVKYENCDHLTYAVDNSEMDMSDNGWLLVKTFSFQGFDKTQESIFKDLIAAKSQAKDLEKLLADKNNRGDRKMFTFHNIYANCELNFKGVESEYRLSFTFNYYEGRPAFISGAPEDCYPEEPAEWEFEDIEINIPPNLWIDLPAGFFKLVEPALFEAMQEKLELEMGEH